MSHNPPRGRKTSFLFTPSPILRQLNERQELRSHIPDPLSENRRPGILHLYASFPLTDDRILDILSLGTSFREIKYKLLSVYTFYSPYIPFTIYFIHHIYIPSIFLPQQLPSLITSPAERPDNERFSHLLADGV